MPEIKLNSTTTSSIRITWAEPETTLDEYSLTINPNDGGEPSSIFIQKLVISFLVHFISKGDLLGMTTYLTALIL